MILIYFPSDDLSIVSVIIKNEFDVITDCFLRVQINTLSDLPKESDITLIVPAQDVLLTSVKLPKLSHKRLQQALPFALEEKLLDDVEQLHFAIGDHDEDHYPVLVVAKEKLNQWLNALKPFELSPSVMLPATLALPYSEKTWSILSDEETATVRTGKLDGFGCDKNNLSVLLELNRVEKSDIEIKHYSEKDFLNNTPINLLQSDYLPKRKTSHNKKIWIMAGYLAAAWIAFSFLSHVVSFFILHHEASTAEIAINKIYQRNFPEAKSIIAPKQRMEDKIKKLTANANKNHLLLLLAKIGKASSQTNGVHLMNLDFRNGQLTLDVTAATFDNLDHFIRQLKGQNLSVKQQNAATTDTQVKANLTIGAA